MNSSQTIIIRAVEWPTEVRTLSCLLDLPVPAQLVDGSCPTVSTRASPLLKELKELLPRSSGRQSETPTDVLDVLDIVLSSVSTLRALSRISSHDNLRSTKPIWSLLIRSLVRACYVDSHALEDAAFVRPRSPYVHGIMEEDGHAFLLMSHLVDDIRPQISQTGNVVSERPSDKVEGRLDRPSGYNYSESETTSYAEESRSRGTSYGWSDTSTDPTSAQSSSIPLDAHILSYWPHPCSAVLPFLCIAGEDDIFDLMSGLLYQRRAWGVVEPVIGIVLSAAGYVGRVVLGWSGEAIRDPDVLPMVHFAHADGTRTDASIGVYDLTDTESALKFAQFILSLRTHVEAVVAQCNQRVFKRLPWRSDTLYLSALWVPDLVGLPPELLLNQSIAITLGPGQSIALTISGGDRARLLLQQSSHFSATGTSTTNSVPPGDPRGRSWLGAKALEGIGSGAKLSFSSYSHDRKMTSIANIKLPVGAVGVDPRLVDEINHQLDFYEDMTRCLKPPIRLLVRCTLVARYTLSSLFMKTVSKRNEASERDGDGDSEVDPDSDNADLGPIKELDQEFGEIIAGSFSHLLWASVGAYTKLLGGKIHNEAEARHDWDALLNLGFVAPDEVASARLILERPGSLSSNVAVDLFKSPEPPNAKQFLDYADSLRRLCLRARDILELLGRPLLSPICLQAE
ncbi:hypothetical protein F5146DRAFT_1134116 [Armillaria mellea]|nr:hypothetical protein F5146DRAFT_1134116 [Armillaria mellea]